MESFICWTLAYSFFSSARRNLESCIFWILSYSFFLISNFGDGLRKLIVPTIHITSISFQQDYLSLSNIAFPLLTCVFRVLELPFGKFIYQLKSQSRAELKCSEATKIPRSFNFKSTFRFLDLLFFKFLFVEFIVKFVCLKFINNIYLLLLIPFISVWRHRN